jgi:putative oxidoreductase
MNKLMSFIISLLKPTKINSSFANLLMAIPRIICGLVLSLDFGASKFGMPWTGSEQNLSLFEVASWFPEDIAKFGFPFSSSPLLFASIAGASEAIGGLFLALGLGTRFWSSMIGITMLVAIFYQKWPDVMEQGVWPILPSLGFLWVCIYGIALGSGKFGMDNLISKKFK